MNSIQYNLRIPISTEYQVTNISFFILLTSYDLLRQKNIHIPVYYGCVYDLLIKLFRYWYDIDM